MMHKKPFTIQELANLLEMRRRNNHHTVLLLGSRSGELFRSEHFYENLQKFSQRSFNELSRIQQFSECYTILTGGQLSETDIHTLLRTSFQELAITQTDVYLATLVANGHFDEIISTNMGDLLEQALKEVGMKEHKEFELFIPNADIFHERSLQSRIIKIFGDFSSRGYIIKGRFSYLDKLRVVKSSLQRLLSQDMLIIGIDPVWDADILRLLPGGTGTMCFVNEEDFTAYEMISNLFQERQAQYIYGSYDTFVRELYDNLYGRIPNSPFVQGIPSQLFDIMQQLRALREVKLFVNREAELQLIEESFSALLEKKHLLRTPVIEVQGTGGMGKTSFMKKVQKRCHDTQLPYIWIDVNQNQIRITHEIITQVKKYAQVDEAFWGQSATHATRFLLQQGPVVMFFDSMDKANTEQLSMIENLLKDLLDDEKLFVILASKKNLLFQRERSVARKMTSLPLKLLNHANCEIYLDRLDRPIEPEIRDLIFEWTRGYPLAMNVLAQAVNDGLDPRTALGRKEALELLTLKVINQEVLKNVRPDEYDRYFASLQIFSVPRRFNLVIMQDLIEEFAPELKRDSSLAYFSLPKEISDTTYVLKWNMLYAGFSIEEPIRNLLLLSLKIEHSERYFAIHAFLAQTNLKLAQEFSGSDRVRYVRECLYHTACDTSSSHLAELLAQAMQVILHEPFLTTFQQFSEEFSQDKELREALNSHLASIQEMISTYTNGAEG